MKLVVNGREMEAEGGITVAGLVESLGLDPKAVIVEHNRTILGRDAWSSASLAEGDILEIVSFVQGG